MNLRYELFQSPRGEFVVLTGRGRVQSAQSTGERLRGVEISIVPEGAPEGDAGFQATIEDFTAPAFAGLFEERVGGSAKCTAFLLRHRNTVFSFRVEVIRKHGVDKTVPIKHIPQRHLFRRVTTLAEATSDSQEVVA